MTMTAWTTAQTMDAVTNTTRAVVTQFYERLAARDLEGVAALFAEEIDWFIPGNESLAPWLGRRRRRHDVLAFFQLLLSSVDPQRVALQHIVVEGPQAVAVGEFASRMRATDTVYESIFSAHFTVEDGRIVRYRFLEDSHGLVLALTD